MLGVCLQVQDMFTFCVENDANLRNFHAYVPLPLKPLVLTSALQFILLAGTSFFTLV